MRPTGIVVLLLVLDSRAAHAWDAQCFEHADETLAPSAYASQSDPPTCDPAAGPNVMHHRWIGPADEHRQIFDRTLSLAGLPDSFRDTIGVRVFTAARTVATGRATYPSLAPVAFADAARAQTRSFEIAELAQLPDYGYALWDWALGAELCPGGGASTDPTECHAFATHLGPVNASHFLPLSEAFYRRGHGLAVARANACSALSAALASTGERGAPYVRACEEEALALEAVAQHYLEDAWSTGHMWQRWGAPDLDSFPGANADDRRARAVLIALAAGLIHGARAVLQALPGWTTYDVNDALCAPNDAVRFVSGNRIEHGVGDDYLPTLLEAASHADSPYAYQYDRLMRCTAAGVLEVYAATAQMHGTLRGDAPFAHPAVDLNTEDCFSQRVTNAAMLTAAGVQYRVLGMQNFLVMDARFVSWALPTVGTTSARAAIDEWHRNRYRLELSRAVSMLRVFAHDAPDGTNAADGGLGDVFGIHPNGAYAARTPLASYEDPDLPWPATRDATTPSATDRATALARVFHRAHVADWCEALDRSALEALRGHVRDTASDATANAVACEVCAEFAGRHLRVGTRTRWDRAAEPVCHLVAPRSAVIYQPANTDATVAPARAWCGC